MWNIINGIIYIFAIIGGSVTVVFIGLAIADKYKNYKRIRYNRDNFIKSEKEEIEKIINNNDIEERIELLLNKLIKIGSSSYVHRITNKDKKSLVDKVYKEIKKYLDKDKLMIEEL